MNEEVEKKRSWTERFFNGIAQKLERSDNGKRLVDHVKSKIGIYSQAWSLSLTLALVILLRCTVVTAFYIPSPSMLDTLKINDRVFVNRLAYMFDDPHVGDIVVFRVPETIPNYDPEKPIWIKRVVGVEGDTVRIDHNRLVINDQLVDDPPFFKKNPYMSNLQNGDRYHDVKVGKNQVLVFGDNSANSYDSRYWGPIDKDRIIGKAFVRFWPPSRIGPIHGESVRPLPPGS
ncbi:MAG: signal peptidase I [Candidatus Omnitrophica bacterium]|nr:signal peptidase I [Candidatus Omnitrophota bacterium]MCA9414947.1 signal peptidase I [Candidatus Omnitrophota bacterium]MCA9431701.1 signal peptidase I [Candidatus Omnitrophota bacterium]MCA9434396.1 signal peptidase I [Candidatus Omnitrophota bacterium]MCA9445887.1 signal peptidase I [Candidatus Omnitrophota bacterium]